MRLREFLGKNPSSGLFSHGVFFELSVKDASSKNKAICMRGIKWWCQIFGREIRESFDHLVTFAQSLSWSWPSKPVKKPKRPNTVLLVHFGDFLLLRDFIFLQLRFISPIALSALWFQNVIVLWLAESKARTYTYSTPSQKITFPRRYARFGPSETSNCSNTKSGRYDPICEFYVITS